MGNEIGQFREWDFEGQIEWFLLEYGMHEAMQRYFAALNHFYLEHPELYERDDSWEGFEWIDADNADQSILAFRRKARPRGKSAPKELIILLNFTPVDRRGFRLGVPFAGRYREVFTSDEPRFGGGGLCNASPIASEDIPWHRHGQSIVLDLPGTSAVILVCEAKRRGRRKTSN